ncbi:hypothetical protein D3C71_1493040 [compost metagenome]
MVRAQAVCGAGGAREGGGGAVALATRGSSGPLHREPTWADGGRYAHWATVDGVDSARHSAQAGLPSWPWCASASPGVLSWNGVVACAAGDPSLLMVVQTSTLCNALRVCIPANNAADKARPNTNRTARVKWWFLRRRSSMDRLSSCQNAIDAGGVPIS